MRFMLGYSLPVAGTTFLFSPAIVVLQGIYAKYFGLELTVIATVFFIARLFDAVTDPIIGAMSDRCRAKGIGRRPWVLGGGLAFIVSGYFLFVPPENVSAGYFLFWFLAFYLAWTMFEIPHYAWGTELTREPSARTRIFTVRGFMNYVGPMIFYTLPFLPVFATRDITPETLKIALVVLALYLVPMLFYTVRYVPDGDYIPSKNKESSLQDVKNILRNKPFRIFVGIYIFTGLGWGMWMSLSFIVFDNYFDIGGQIAGMFLLAKLAAIVSLPLWYGMIHRLGKKTTWLVSQILLMLIILVIFFVSPGKQAYLPLLLVVMGVYVMTASYTIIAPAWLADVIDYGAWKFGTDQAGTYFAVYTFMVKTTAGLGGALGLVVLGWQGFDPGVGVVNVDDAQFAIQLAFCLLPAMMFLVTLIFIAIMPLTAHRSYIIRHRLEQRMQRNG